MQISEKMENKCEKKNGKKTAHMYVKTKGEFIVSRNYRMPIYRTFQYIEEYIVSNLPYWVSRYSQNQWFFLSFFAENSENSPKILKIRRKFLKKKVFFEALISYRIVSYREKNPHIVSISYRIEKKLIATQCTQQYYHLFQTFNMPRKRGTARILRGLPIQISRLTRTI
mgnify:CR=1 FL=1